MYGFGVESTRPKRSVKVGVKDVERAETEGVREFIDGPSLAAATERPSFMINSCGTLDTGLFFSLMESLY